MKITFYIHPKSPLYHIPDGHIKIRSKFYPRDFVYLGDSDN